MTLPGGVAVGIACYNRACSSYTFRRCLLTCRVSVYALYQFNSCDRPTALWASRQGDLENTFTLPSYVRTDAAIYYRRDNWRVGLNIKNLFDVYYFESADSIDSVYPGAPFTILGTVSVQF
ncbi:MAG: TonB-dependent receptor [Nostoc sp.]|uniref:TonB-dependent receptor n=1 Tax=Nostoc sp. TaxID=1180 RepID=UPI002FFAA5AB